MLSLTIIASFVVLFFLFILVWSWITGISPMPSSPKAVQTVITALKKIWPEVEQQNVLIEAGSGWGTLLFPIARAFPRIRMVGYELSPVPCLFSALVARIGGYDNVRVIRKSFREADLAGVHFIVSYLHPDGMEQLRHKLETEAQGTIYIISNTFRFRTWEPVQSYTVHDMYRSNVYVYKMRFA